MYYYKAQKKKKKNWLKLQNFGPYFLLRLTLAHEVITICLQTKQPAYFLRLV